MMQAHPVPYVHARGSLAVERMTCSSVALFGACQGTNQIQLRAGIDDPADAAENSVHFAEGSESIDVNGRQAGSLQYQFLFAHEHPRNKLVTSRGLFLGENLTQGKRNRAQASSRFFARDQWSKLHSASRYQLAATPSECAPAVTQPPPSHVMAGAVISINSIPDIART